MSTVFLRNLKSTLIVGILSVAFFAWPAEKVSLPEHLNQAIELYQRQEYQRASLYFCYILASDPNNGEAHGYVNEILGQSLPPAHKAQLDKFLETVDYLNFLQSRTHELSQKSRNLEKFIYANRKDAQKIADLISRSDKVLTRRDGPESISADILGGDLGNFDFLFTFLAKKKEKLVSGIRVLQERYDRLYAIKRMIVAQDSTLQPEPLALSVEQEAPLGKVDPQKKIKHLTGELKEKSLELFEKEGAIASQREEFKKLDEELRETLERLNLVQRIIQEKDEIISALEVHILELKESSGEQSQYSRKQLEVLKEKLQFLQEKINEQKEFKNEKVLNLEKLLAEQELQFARFNKALEENERNIRRLNTRFVLKSKRIATLKRILQSKDEKIFEQDGIIQIYQGKLKETNDKLKKRFKDAEDNLNLSQQKVRELHQRVMQLESQFSGVQKKSAPFAE